MTGYMAKTVDYVRGSTVAQLERSMVCERQTIAIANKVYERGPKIDDERSGGEVMTGGHR